MPERLRRLFRKWHAWIFCEQDDITLYASNLVRLAHSYKGSPQQKFISLTTALGISMRVPFHIEPDDCAWLTRHHLVVALMAKYPHLSYSTAAITINKTYETIGL